MSTRSEKISVTDRTGFIYEVIIEHKPHFGFSTAMHSGQIIGQVELGRITEPSTDDDLEWERYEERFGEWADEIRVNLARICVSHFNSCLLGNKKGPH